MKDRAKRAGAQRKEEESERKSLQVLISQNLLYIIIKPLSLTVFSPSSPTFFPPSVQFLDQVGTDRKWTQKSVKGVPRSEELPGSKRHQCPSAPKHHHHTHPETHHRPQERGQTFLWDAETMSLKKGLRLTYGLIVKAAFWIWKGFRCVIYYNDPCSFITGKENFTQISGEIFYCWFEFFNPPPAIHQNLCSISW